MGKKQGQALSGLPLDATPTRKRRRRIRGDAAFEGCGIAMQQI
jgi:hypothetical protein